MNVCPSDINLILTKGMETSEEYKDNLFSNIFELIDDERTAHIKKIYANTPIPFSILFLGCHNWKDQPQYFCNKLSNPQAEIKACESNKTNYVYFYIRRWFKEKSENKPNEYPMYILIFAHYSKNDYEITKKITDEVKSTADWLCISESTIQCYIFYYTTSHQSNTFDLGALKENYNDLCKDTKYIFQFKFVCPKEKPQYLSINGGLPRFTIEAQEM
jgi:hypothetical protein